MIGVGAMIGAGIFVLTGVAAGVAGPAILLAFLFNGLVAFFTASAYAELGGSIPEAGGGYLWVKESLPQPTGFLAGWMSWMAHSVACSLYAVGFGAYMMELLASMGISLPISAVIWKKLLAVIVIALFSLINIRGAKETGNAGTLVTVMKVLVLFIFVALGFHLIFREPVRFEHFRPFFPKGYLGILTAMGLTYIAFEGYEIIAQSGEEIKNPEKNIPKAIFYSLLIVVPIYILVAFVALGVVNPGGIPPWDFLAKQKEIAIVDAARQITKWGGPLLLFGGLLSTASALNATIYSSSRVSFAMGRDYNLPTIFSSIHRRFRTPNGSIIVSSALIVLMALIFPLEDIASSADVMFLFLFILVNIALLHIRSKNPRKLKGYKSPLFPLFPLLAILSQAVLIVVMFFYSPKTFFLSLLWIGGGLSIYYAYSRFKEKEEVGPVVVVEEKELVHRDFRIVIGVEERSEVEPLMLLAVPIAKESEGEIFVTHVIALPPQTPLRVGSRFLRERKEFLEEADKIGERNKIPVSFNIRVSHRVHRGILDSVIENHGNLLLLGAGRFTKRGRIIGTVLDPLLQEAPCDIGIYRAERGVKVKNVLVPTAGGPNAKLALKLGLSLVRSEKGKLTLLFVARSEANLKR
jgi:amino acid transporter